MDNATKKYIVISVVVSLAIVWGFSYFFVKPSVEKTITERIIEKITGQKGEKGDRGDQGEFGAVSGPTISSNCLSVGGVERCYYREGFTATSSMLCRIKTPTMGTSTLVSFGARWTGGVLGVNTFDVSTTTDPTGYGSSTPALIYAASIPSNADNRILTWQPNSGTTTSSDISSGAVNPQATARGILPSLRADGSTNLLFSTSTWLTLKYATSAPGVFATPATGFCNAVFESL